MQRERSTLWRKTVKDGAANLTLQESQKEGRHDCSLPSYKGNKVDKEDLFIWYEGVTREHDKELKVTIAKNAQRNSFSHTDAQICEIALAKKLYNQKVQGSSKLGSTDDEMRT